MEEVYLIKWRAKYVANNTDEAETSRSIKNVKWANEKTHKELKMEVDDNQHTHKGFHLSNTTDSIVNQTKPCYFIFFIFLVTWKS